MKSLPLVHAALIASSLCLTSCERQKMLLKEKGRLDAEYKQALEEIQTIEQRLLSLGSQVSSASLNMERQTAAAEQKAANLEAEVNSLEQSVKALEAATKEYSGKVDAYKAKYLR